MTFAPPSILAARAVIRQVLPEIPVVGLGVVGDDNHTQGGSSYHLGKSALRPDSYSIVESARDRAGLSEAASALDFGMWSRGNHNLRTFSIWLVQQCQAGKPDTLDIREVIYSPDGKIVKRWDRLGKRTTGPGSHTTHTHTSWFRDSENHDKTAIFRRYFTEIGLLEETVDQKDADLVVDTLLNRVLPFPYDAKNPTRTIRDLLRYIASASTTATYIDTKLAPRFALLTNAMNGLSEAAGQPVDLADDDVAAIVSGLLAGLPNDLAKRIVDEEAARLAE